jgi:hypothetical protein
LELRECPPGGGKTKDALPLIREKTPLSLKNTALFRSMLALKRATLSLKNRKTPKQSGASLPT